jgi:hypothetical protein
MKRAPCARDYEGADCFQLGENAGCGGPGRARHIDPLSGLGGGSAEHDAACSRARGDRGAEAERYGALVREQPCQDSAVHARTRRA